MTNLSDIHQQLPIGSELCFRRQWEVSIKGVLFLERQSKYLPKFLGSATFSKKLMEVSTDAYKEG